MQRVRLLAFLLLQVSVASGQTEPAANLDALVLSPGLWQATPDAFMKAFQNAGFVWTSATKESARADGKRVPLSLLGQPAGETIVFFSGEKPRQVQISIHNRGDNGTIKEDAYLNTIEHITTALTQQTKVAAIDRGKDNKSATRAEGYLWNTATSAFLLEFSSQKEVKSKGIPFRSEFIRLRAIPATVPGTATGGKPSRVTRADLPSQVVRKDGDTFIQGIPMVDQGEKGYCVVAATARVFGYYGIQVDQHEIAQIADSSAEGGTNTTGMIEALDRIAGRFKVRVKTHEEMEYSDLGDLVEDYNRIAKRKGEKELNTDPSFNMWGNFDEFKPDVLKESRLRDTGALKSFKAEIQRSIDSGVPLLWTVTVGIFPEEKINPQSRGGHMRLIIGYNWEKNQVIYTDSWGAGHEFKRWGVDEAFCAGHGMYSVQPIL